MSFEPQKLFIGLMDFFAILLPGALLSYALKDSLGPRLFGSGYYQLSGAEGWVVFLFSAYLFGHFIFLIGARFLDDYFYDPIRSATPASQMNRLARGKKLPWHMTKWLATLLIKKQGEADQAVYLAERIKEHNLDRVGGSSSMNSFQWCKATLTLDHHEAMATVERFEADSKFFRSLVVVLPVLIVWLWVETGAVVALASLPLLALAFWRYVDQRLKSVNQAYWYVINLESQKEDGLRLAPASRPSHAGGVVTRRHRGHIEYLLVQATGAPGTWVLPKGHIEQGERRQEAAVREVHEETGVWARICADLRTVSYSVNGERVSVQFYVMEALQVTKPSETREHTWLPLTDAVRRATHHESQELLRRASEWEGA